MTPLLLLSLLNWVPDWAAIGGLLATLTRGGFWLYNRRSSGPAGPGFWTKLAGWLRNQEKVLRLSGDVKYLEGQLEIVKAQLAEARASGPASGSGSAPRHDGTPTRIPTSHESQGYETESQKSGRNSLTPQLSKDSAGRRRHRGRPEAPGKTP